MVVVRKLELQDLHHTFQLSNAEKWNQTKRDWEFLIVNPGNVCLAAEAGGKIVGTATAIIYSNQLAWIGMVLVDKNHRGKGISKLLLSKLLGKLDYCASVKLDATPAGQPVYQKFGFKKEYLIHRMTAVSLQQNLHSSELNDSILPVKPNFIKEIVEFDHRIFGSNRKQLIEYLVENCPENSWKVRHDNRISGFALGRRGERFHQVGPVFAPSTRAAKNLILKSLQSLEGGQVVIDVLDAAEDLACWLETIGFTKQRHFVRMYKNENLFPGNPARQFAICGPEFG